MILRWEEPPPPSRRPKQPQRSERWAAAARQLRARPGVWGVLSESDTSGSGTGLGAAVKGGALVAFRPVGDWEAVSRFINGRWITFARYVGPAESTKDGDR